ncbi:2-5A-dependent ribonuclease [Rhineura floridana]|uniref:2-5A-dependent ribonuclease n=1 Tax=Rhineura floridana TaxID=261503 RepID=UPI002AC88698|nr:2-5A-dependent ribonuclease [Rhineura floridana]
MAADNEISFQLNSAVRRGSIETVRRLMEEGANINSKVNDGWTALHSAVQNDEEEIARLLLDKGADPLARKDNKATPFILAGITGNVELLKLFLQMGSDINEHDFNGFTAFMEAARYGREEALKFLYESKADVNLGRVVDEEKKSLNKGGETALMDAARCGHLSVVKALVEEMNAGVNICDNWERNALVHALSVTKNDQAQDKEAVALFLLKHGADVNKRDEVGKTTLILAAERQSQDVVRAILGENEVDVNDADRNDITALMAAVKKENYEIAQILCEKGARTDIGDLIEIASRTYNNKMIKLLHQYRPLASPRQPEIQWSSSSRRWQSKLQDLRGKYRPMIGKLKIFMLPDFRIQRSSHGGVYLGFYNEEEVAVKIFPTSAENAEREKTCLEKCRISNHLVKFCGWEEQKSCLYLCLSLCEKNLEEYFRTPEIKNATIKNKDILETIFQAVKEMHSFGFGHQDLHPSNILIDVTGKIFLADFDKSRKINDGEKDVIITEDLQALRNLVLYVAMRGKICFGDLPAQCPEDVADHKEIEDLRAGLESPDENIPVSEQLGQLIYHPYFWNKQTKYRVLRDVGNESDIKTRNTMNHNSTSKILKALNREENPFKDWKGRIDKDVLDCMVRPFHDQGKKKKNERSYENCVTDLLKLIRNMGEHFNEKDEMVREIIKEPADYFLNLFPNLTIYVYRSLHNIQYDKHFPNAQNPSQL